MCVLSVFVSVLSYACARRCMYDISNIVRYAYHINNRLHFSKGRSIWLHCVALSFPSLQ